MENLKKGKFMKEYYLVSESSTMLLDSAVSKYLREGWELYGNPVVIRTSSGIYFYQAVVR